MSLDYQGRKAAGLCPVCGIGAPQEGYAFCVHCRYNAAKARQPNLTPDAWRVHEALRLNRGQARKENTLALRSIPGPVLMHCGKAWPIMPEQVRCGACGQTYREEC